MGKKMMIDKLKELRSGALKSLESAQSLDEIESIKISFLGKKGELTQILRNLGTVEASQRREIGSTANQIKAEISEIISEKIHDIKNKSLEENLRKDSLDITLPGRKQADGSIHPINTIMDEVIDIFASIGFWLENGPEVELDFFNFEALNIPHDHPARDMHDTFYTDNGIVLRTHTSPVQIRTMKQKKPPLRILSPGKVYRSDYDISHLPMFHQIEGLLVDAEVSFGDLKGILKYFVQRMFDSKTKIRFRPSYFPFTEPSAEVDMQCQLCKGKGCRTCSQTGWLEIAGCGLVDPEVFKNVEYDINSNSGFAFGMGIDRIAMLKYQISDIRSFYTNDYRFLNQFTK